MLNTYPQFNTLDEANDHVQFNCRGPCLCVVDGQLWDVHGGGYVVPADDGDVTAWKLARPSGPVSVKTNDTREQGWSSWVTVVELEFQHVTRDPAVPDRAGPRPDRLHDGLNMAVTSLSRNGAFAWLSDGTVAHVDWLAEKRCFARRDGQGDLQLTDLRAWAAVPWPIAKA